MSQGRHDPEDSISWRGRSLKLSAPARWLALGLSDLLRCPVPGLLHGLVASAFAWWLVWQAHDRFWLLSGAFSGFLIVAPLLASAIYQVSFDLERGHRTGFVSSLRVWRRRDGRMIAFGVLLGLSGTGWVISSASLITAWAQQPILTPMDFLRHVVIAETGWLFEAWLCLGALLAAPMFASSVVALPLLLDQPHVTLRSAVLQSWLAVLNHPVICGIWAFALMSLTLLGMALGLLGLIVILPWLGHASWHAYRDLRPGSIHDASLGGSSRMWY